METGKLMPEQTMNRTLLRLSFIALAAMMTNIFALATSLFSMTTKASLNRLATPTMRSVLPGA